jgi:hypothetical protein
MKKIFIVVAALVMFYGTGNVFAANLQKGSFGISVGMGDSVFGHKAIPMVDKMVNDVVDLSVRYMMGDTMAVMGGFGLQIDGGDADATYLSLSGGVRKYLKTDDFAPFVGGQVSLIMLEADPNIADLTILDLSAEFGAEYFFSKQFSMEGSVGVGLGQASDDITNTDDTYFGTRTMGVRANFYF